jgi:spermidine synthase
LNAAHPASARQPGRWGLRPLEAFILLLFFISGASALIYEVVWTRDLTTVFGGSAFAIATVLAAYMAGLALGSTVFGRSIDRRGHPLVVYGLLEGGIALWAVLLPTLLALLDHVYAGIYRSVSPGFYGLSLIRFALSFVILLVPTTLMGGTLPVLGKLLFTNWKGLGTRAGLLYAANTLGAVLGTAAGGFLLLPAMGLRGATWLAVILNFGVAIAAVLASRRFRYDAPATTVSPNAADVVAAPVEETKPRGTASPDRLRRAVLIVYAASGFAALAYEVAWTKTLSMILGTTNYAFTSMLTTFLLGLAVGSLLFARLADRYGRPEALLALVQMGITFFALLTIPLLEALPQLFVNAFPHLDGSWTRIELYRILLAAMTMFLPTLLMGGTFPLVIRAYVDRRETGKSIGSLYAANTIGAIFGSFLTGFVLVPWIGRQNAILAASFVNVAAAGVLLFVLRGRSAPGRMRLAIAVMAILLVPAWIWGFKRWDPLVMASGAYVYAREYAREGSIKKVMGEQTLLYYKESTEGTVSVWQAQQVTSLRISGKADASSHGDMITQKLISHLPLFYHQGRPENGLVIGLASGASTGSLLTHPFKQVETVELIPSMAEAARYFDEFNHKCMVDPRHRLLINDGRNHLRLTSDRYDVIVSEPTNPWIAGVGALFTREFFELTKARLKPGGVVCQWVQTYQYRPQDLKTVLATFTDAYPYLHLWQGAPGDLILVGSNDPLKFDLRRLREALRTPAGEDLAQLEILPEAQILSYFVTDRDGINAYIGDWKRRVTDDNLYLEYTVPRHMFETTGRVSVVDLAAFALPPSALLGGDADSALTADIGVFSRAHALAVGVFLGIPLPAGAQGPDEVLDRALSIAPQEVVARRLRSRSLNETAIQALLADDIATARPLFLRAVAIGDRGERGLALNNLGAIAFRGGELDTARAYWEAAGRLEPNFPDVNYNLAILTAGEGRYADAVDLFRQVTRMEPQNARVFNNLAYYAAMGGGDLIEAERAARRAVDLDPQPNYLDTLGYVLVRRERWDEAERTLTKARKGDPASMEILLHLGMAQAGGGRDALARDSFERVARDAQDPKLARQAREELAKL